MQAENRENPPEELVSSSERKIPVRDRSIFTNPSSFELEILNRLEEKARLFQEKEVREKSPAYLVTVDQFRNQVNAPVFQRSLEKILDSHNHGRNRVAYLYPYLIKDAGQVVVKLALVYPPLENGIRDAMPFCKMLFDASKPAIDALLQGRRKKGLSLPEENPGAYLIVTRSDKQSAFVPRRLSLESEFKRTIQKEFSRIELTPLPTDDFIDRLRVYLKSHNMVQQITPEYHIIVDELKLNDKGEYQVQPELVQHYRAQVDALEKHLVPWLANKAKSLNRPAFVQAVEEFQEEFAPPVEGRNQRNEKAQALVSLVNSFSTESISDEGFLKTWEKIQESFSVLDKINQLKNNLIRRRHEQNVENLLTRLSHKIRRRSAEPAIRDITHLDLRSELSKVNIIDESDIDEYAQLLLDKLATQFGYFVEAESEKKFASVYLVDLSYYLAIEAHLARRAVNHNEYLERLEILNRIKNSITPGHHLESSLNSQIDAGQRAEFAAAANRHSNERAERIKREEFSRKFNMSQGVLLSLVYFMILAAIASQVSWYIMIGAVVLWPILIPLLFKRWQRSSKGEKVRGAMKTKVADLEEDSSVVDVEVARKEKQKNFYKKVTETVSGLLLPVRFKTLADRSFSTHDLVQNLPLLVERIGEFAKIKSDKPKVLRNIDLALANAFVKIKLPEELEKGDEATYWYIPASDFKTSKEALGQGYRDLMKEHTPGSYNHELFKHLVNCIEMYHHPQYKKFIIQPR